MPERALSDQLCACGCGQFTTLQPKTVPSRGLVAGTPNKYLKGHSSRSRQIRDLRDELGDPNPSGLCLCGCGKPTALSKHTDPLKGTVFGKHTRYLTGHQNAVRSLGEPLNPTGLCLCGCGESTPIVKVSSRKRGLVAGEHRRFIHGHNGRLRPKTVPDPNPEGLCECGCGEQVGRMQNGNHYRFVRGHSSRDPRPLYVVDAGGCWIWARHRDKAGYGKCGRGRDRGGTISAHRWMWEELIGPLPSHLHLHHECENKACVNPRHLHPLALAAHKKHHATLSRG